MDRLSTAPATAAGRMPSVSAVVATRDRPALLQRAVRSILAQTYPGDIECVVVFDQSAPTEIEVEQSGSRRLRIMTNARAPGLAGARNTGIMSGSGHFVAFCDDDDTWDRDKLISQAERLRSASAEFAACGTRIHYSDHVIERIPPAEVSLGDLIRSRVSAVHPSTFIARREALIDMGLVDEDIPGSYGEDYDFLLRAARRMPVVAVKKPLVDVYWHPQSFFADGWAARADALAYLVEKHPEFKADRRGFARMQGRIAFAEAALTRRQAACRSSLRALRRNPLERRAYLALGVASGVISPTSVARLANQRGYGV